MPESIIQKGPDLFAVESPPRPRFRMSDRLFILSATADPAEPFSLPEGVAFHSMREATAGGSPLLHTRFAVWRDAASLRILFRAEDEREVRASHYERDSPLYNEDVVEVFLSVGNPARYVEIEISPIASIFDAWVDTPHGVRSSMNVDSDWNCEGLLAATRRTRQTGTLWCWETALSIPFSSVEAEPHEGDVWLANFYRIDRRADGTVEYSAWRPTLKTPADFHVVAAFGGLQFR